MNLILTPDTTNYLIAGYAVIAVMIGGYILSLVLRWQQNIHRWKDLQEKK